MDPENGLGGAVERRRGKIQGRIGKLERQVRKLENCVAAQVTNLPPEERNRLKMEITRLAARLHEAAERRLDRIAESL